MGKRKRRQQQQQDQVWRQPQTQAPDPKTYSIVNGVVVFHPDTVEGRRWAAEQQSIKPTR